MKVPFTEVEQQARALATEDRARLAETLLESLHAPQADIEAAWAREIEDRVAAFERGDMPAYAAQDAFAQARLLAK